MTKWSGLVLLIGAQAAWAHGPLGESRMLTPPGTASTAVSVEKRLRDGEGYRVLRVFDAQARQAPNDPAPHVRAAKVYERLGDVPAASASATEALALDGSNAEALALLGRLAAREADWETAAHYLRRAVTSNPTSPSAQLALGGALEHLGDKTGSDTAYATYRSLVGLPQLDAVP